MHIELRGHYAPLQQLIRAQILHGPATAPPQPQDSLILFPPTKPNTTNYFSSHSKVLRRRGRRWLSGLGELPPIKPPRHSNSPRFQSCWFLRPPCLPMPSVLKQRFSNIFSCHGPRNWYVFAHGQRVWAKEPPWEKICQHLSNREDLLAQRELHCKTLWTCRSASFEKQNILTGFHTFLLIPRRINKGLIVQKRSDPSTQKFQKGG